MSQVSPRNDPSPGRAGSIGLLIFLGLILVCVTAIRVRLLSAPLERDEGEYAYGGQLLLQGKELYRWIYTMKWPGTHAAYAAIMAVFGQTPAGIHLGLILVNLVTAFLVFQLARQTAGELAGVAAATTYALLSINPVMLGLAAHATHFVVLPALAGILLLQKLDEKTSHWQIFLAGLLLGVAGLMKQAGVVFGVFGVAWLMWRECRFARLEPRRLAVRLGLLVAGGVLPIGLVCVVIGVTGAFGQFWFWTVQYARVYSREWSAATGLSELWRDLLPGLFKTAPGLWIAAGVGIVLLFLDRSLRPQRVFVIGLTLCSLVGVCPGWYFRGHYFLLLLPCVGLLTGIAVQSGCSWIARFRNPGQAPWLALLVLAGLSGWTLFSDRNFFFRGNPRDFWSRNYIPSFFGEALFIGEYIQGHCPPGGRVAVLGSEPEILFYSHRLTATGLIYMYPLMESQPFALEMQLQLTQEIENAQPDYVVWVHDDYSWLRRPDSHGVIFDWFPKYAETNLQLVGWVERRSPPQSEIHLVSAADPSGPQSDSWVAILRRKDSAPRGATR